MDMGTKGAGNFMSIIIIPTPGKGNEFPGDTLLICQSTTGQIPKGMKKTKRAPTVVDWSTQIWPLWYSMI